MSKKQKPNSLVLAIVFASIVISASLLFFATQIANSGAVIDQETIAEAIDQYVANLEAGGEREAQAIEVVPVSDQDHIYGNPDAEISLIEYSDFECPYCKRFHPTAKEVVEAYDGKVNWIYRHFPLDFHDPLATKQAEASECVAEIAGNDAFWIYTDLIFETTRSNGKGMDIADLSRIAVEMEINEGDFNECLNSGRYLDTVKQAISDGKNAGISGTPGNIIYVDKTGEAVSVSGAQPFESFKSVIDKLL